MKKSVALLVLAILLSFAGCDSSIPAVQEDGFTFTYNGYQIHLNTDAATVLTALGEPKGCTEETSCAFDGLDKTYYYGSFYLSTYSLEEKDYVYSIWFVDDSVSTEEGIRIGCTQAEVEAVYCADRFNGSNAYTLTKGDTKLTIILTGGLVSSVQYEALLE